MLLFFSPDSGTCRLFLRRPWGISQMAPSVRRGKATTTGGRDEHPSRFVHDRRIGDGRFHFHQLIRAGTGRLPSRSRRCAQGCFARRVQRQAPDRPGEADQAAQARQGCGQGQAHGQPDPRQQRRSEGRGPRARRGQEGRSVHVRPEDWRGFPALHRRRGRQGVRGGEGLHPDGRAARSRLHREGEQVHRSFQGFEKGRIHHDHRARLRQGQGQEGAALHPVQALQQARAHLLRRRR